MPKKLLVDELLRRACIYAEIDRAAFIVCYESIPDDPEAIAAQEFLDQLQAYRMKRWGKTSVEAAMDECEPVPIIEIWKQR